MNSTLPKNRSVCIVVKFARDFTGNCRLIKAVCADYLTAKSWLKDFAKAWDFDCFDLIDEECRFRFFTLIDGKFSKLPTEEALNIVNEKFA